VYRAKKNKKIKEDWFLVIFSFDSDCSRREKESEKKNTKSSLVARSQDRIPVAYRELRKLQFSNLLSAPMTTWSLVAVATALASRLEILAVASYIKLSYVLVPRP